jgi:hypothetical protein
VDADMRVPGDMGREIRVVIEDENHDAYRFQLESYFINHPIKFGGRQRWNNPWLVRCGKGIWKQKIHESLVLDVPPNRIGQLRGRMWHINDQSWEERMRKSIEYSLVERDRILREGRLIGVGATIWQPARTFLRTFLLMQGVRDGMIGLVWCLHCATAVFHWYALAWDAQNRIDRAEIESRLRGTWDQGAPL